MTGSQFRCAGDLAEASSCKTQSAIAAKTCKLTSRSLRSSHSLTSSQVDRIWGNIRVILGPYGDNGKENGNYYNGLHGVYIEHGVYGILFSTRSPEASDHKPQTAIGKSFKDV